MDILQTKRNHVAFITLNRPATLNALTFDMIVELHAMMRRCAADPDVRAVLIRGAGEKAFCAGGDIRALYQSFRDSGSLHQEFFVAEYALDHFLYSFPKPYIAFLDGITMGGGMGIAQSSRLRIVGERTRMAMPEVAIGLVPDVGASYFLSRLPGSLGPYLALTGVQMRAPDALYAGLADVLLARAEADRLEAELAGLAWSEDWRADIDRTVRGLAAAHALESPLALLRPAIDRHFAQERLPAILASLNDERRKELVDWARQTAALMNARSPTMMAVTLRELQRGRSMSLADCFRMELGLVRHCFAQGDVIEGVRAMIIDKDNSPRWRPNRVDEVTDASIEEFFRDPWAGATHPLAALTEQST